ncbi:E4 ORFD [Canine mastadenovirus A]|uniref:E4 ORF4 n=3 Tax=Canine mastadenovirus A TaxID=10537 RepID=P87569_ADECT|nr:E4 ORFD [Canine adenovirus 2]WIV79566.1 E4 ORFD [Canine mastadenovirus A]AAB38736.1 E4 ORF4 [Canine adenovirus 2]QJS39041.1 E4 ORF4 [Canine adenovirus 2]UZP80974.1 E4 ORF4 [Canine adenovirus 2]WET32008.1 E4 ORF4 [Canine adenovirus 2]
MAHHRLPRVCVKGIIHFEEDFVRELGSMLESPMEFLFDTIDDVTASIFCESMFKAVDKNKPGITFKVVFYSQLGFEYDDALAHFKGTLIKEISDVVNNHPNVNNAFRGREIVTVSLLEVFSFCS